MMRPIRLWIALCTVLLLSSPGVQASLNDNELRFAQIPQAHSARNHLQYITSVPHVASFAGDYQMAHYVLNHFEQNNLQASIFELTVQINYPIQRPRVAILEKQKQNNTQVVFEASLSEDVLDFDTTSDTPWRNHTFHGYSPSGSVRAPAVYANYGRPQDFERLAQMGIDIRDKIVIVRYGECFRGLKVWNAQRRGAVGVLIYSDPQDDVFGNVYPDGPWRPPSSVQRGSVQFNSLCAGDPYRIDPRYHDKTLYDICGVEHSTLLIPTIPSLPLSYGDARELLIRLGGKPAQDIGQDFVGGLDIDYTVGPSNDTLLYTLSTHHRDEIRTIPNVVATIPGTDSDNDMPILLGNHRDAWVYGAADPNSGTSALLEVASGLGELLRNGWKPRRTIYLLSWSGEEYGLLGSTGWAELNSDLLERAVAYLNADTVVSGDTLSVAATPALTSLWKGVLHDLHESEEHAFAFANGPLGEIVDANTNWVLNEPDTIKMLGSGSDYTAFLDHLGIASLDFSFGKKSGHYGVYHSVYDSFAWMNAYGGIDSQVGSSFDLIAFASKIWGILALRLADSPILPLDHVVQAEALEHYSDSIAKQETGMDLSDLNAAIEDYKLAADSVKASCFGVNVRAASTTAECNDKLGLTERQFLSAKGLPERPWFKHVLQAPGLYLGYAAEAFPGIQQAIDEGDLDFAQEQVTIVTERIQSAAAFLRVDAAILAVQSQS